MVGKINKILLNKKAVQDVPPQVIDSKKPDHASGIDPDPTARGPLGRDQAIQR